MGKIYYQDRNGDIRINKTGRPSPDKDPTISEAVIEDAGKLSLLKTINGESLIGSGDIVIGGGSGSIGPTGPQGPQGKPGKDGKDGINGAQGPVGPTGAKGADGIKGADGDIGPTGPTGAAGLTTAISVNNETYIQTAGTIILPNYPTVPTDISAFTNDVGYLTQHQSLDNYATKSFVTDLTSSLQVEITPSNKLSSDLVDDTNYTNKFVTASEKTDIASTKAKTTNITYDSSVGTTISGTTYLTNVFIDGITTAPAYYPTLSEGDKGKSLNTVLGEKIINGGLPISWSSSVAEYAVCAAVHDKLGNDIADSYLLKTDGIQSFSINGTPVHNGDDITVSGQVISNYVTGISIDSDGELAYFGPNSVTLIGRIRCYIDSYYISFTQTLNDGISYDISMTLSIGSLSSHAPESIVELFRAIGAPDGSKYIPIGGGIKNNSTGEIFPLLYIKPYSVDSCPFTIAWFGHEQSCSNPDYSNVVMHCHISPKYSINDDYDF